MSNEEVIEQLKTMYPKKCKMVDGRYTGGFDDHNSKGGTALDMAIEALEKQIPKEVIRKNIREYYRFYCPNNHFIFEEHCKIFDLNKHDFSKSGYCECCGQKLNWSEWE